jgi:uncharacterized protein YutE (UPF0331/DUF86 family)
VVDKTVLSSKIAAVRDAVSRIRAVLPPSAEAFSEDRTAREVVTWNLFLALQESISLATHWLSDEGWSVPRTHGEVFSALAEQHVIDGALASRLRAAAGLRNLLAHQYGVVDFSRLYAIASSDLDDLLAFCRALAERAGAD